MSKTPHERAEIVYAGVRRASGLATAAKFLGRSEYTEWTELEISSFMNGLEELGSAILDALSPALEESSFLCRAPSEQKADAA